MVTKEEVKNWYDTKYHAPERAGRPYDAYPCILEHIKAGRTGKLLDIACGGGFLLLAASRRGLETFGIDISAEAIKKAGSVSPASVLNVGSAEDLGYADGTFDYITCLGALEHFIDMDKALQEMKRVAKEGATFCVLVPNSRFLLWKLLDKHGTEQRDINEKLLNLQEWKSIFTASGFKIVCVRRDRWYLKFHSTSIAGLIKRLVCRLVWFLIPLKYDYQFAFILKK